MIRTRFAPSPTGDLHLGGVWVALASWVLARSEGALVLRVEDLDRPRVVAGSEARIIDDLRWLGIAWDEGPRRGGPFAPYRQSERGAVYQAALAKLTELGLTYPCDCSRADIERVASAPHSGEELVYPGTCREKSPRRSFRRSPALRLSTAGAGMVAFDDAIMGHTTQDVAREVGDFVLQRGDGIIAYQLAVAVDDARMAITDVLRGADLIPSTPRQLYVMRLLGLPEPRYWHLPLVVAADGERLAKRTRGVRVSDLRTRGVAAEEIVGRVAHALGLTEREGPCRVEDLRPPAEANAWRRDPWRAPSEWAGDSA